MSEISEAARKAMRVGWVYGFMIGVSLSGAIASAIWLIYETRTAP